MYFLIAQQFIERKCWREKIGLLIGACEITTAVIWISQGSICKKFSNSDIF